MDEWMDEWMEDDGWTDGWMDGWMDGTVMKRARLRSWGQAGRMGFRFRIDEME